MNATYLNDKALVLESLGLFTEAVICYEEAMKLDPSTYQRFASLLLRFGHVEKARSLVKEPFDVNFLHRLVKVEEHMSKCTIARSQHEWNTVLIEVTAAMEAGVDFSPQLTMCEIEALLKLDNVFEAQLTLEFVPAIEPFPASLSNAQFFNMICGAYTYFVESQLLLALGRFDDALNVARAAARLDPLNCEIQNVKEIVSEVADACSKGMLLFESAKYMEAISEYEKGLKADPFNATLLCHRADCFFKVERWERSVEDCDHALVVLPNYGKARRLRADSYGRLDQAVSEYEILSENVPKSQPVQNTNSDVKEVSCVEELKTGVATQTSIVLFMKTSDVKCNESAAIIEDLSFRYPSINFLKVDLDKCSPVGLVEQVKAVPIVKIYKRGILIKDIVSQRRGVLEGSVSLLVLHPFNQLSQVKHQMVLVSTTLVKHKQLMQLEMLVDWDFLVKATSGKRLLQ